MVIDPLRNLSIREWSNKSEVFGNQVPNADPDGDGVAFELALRFPGQQATGASGLFYNYQREYDPAVGRYSQSDPIGLAGGITTYGYAFSSPVVNYDPDGEQSRRAVPAPPLTTSEVLARATVPNLVTQIRRYEPTFMYQTVGPTGYRYNRQDVDFLMNILNQHRARRLQSCPLAIDYGRTPGGTPLTRHYSTERVDRNIPVSLVDSIINTFPPRYERGANSYYDPVNNVTVVVGRNGVVTSHKGK